MKEIKLYHFFVWADAYGWQHLGSSDGYETIEELKRDCQFHINNREKHKIMKLVEVCQNE